MNAKIDKLESDLENNRQKIIVLNSKLNNQDSQLKDKDRINSDLRTQIKELE